VLKNGFGGAAQIEIDTVEAKISKDYRRFVEAVGIFAKQLADYGALNCGIKKMSKKLDATAAKTFGGNKFGKQKIGPGD